MELYWFHNGRDTLDYLASTYIGTGPQQARVDYLYTLYSMDKDGRFVRQKDGTGTPWQMMQSTFPNDSTKADTLSKQHWIEEPDLYAN
jgi:hypothetical protein